MKTRSQLKEEQTQNKPLQPSIEIETKREMENITLYIVDIDFDEASIMWKANKKRIGNGSYKYICSQITKSGNKCKRESLQGCHYCRIHYLH